MEEEMDQWVLICYVMVFYYNEIHYYQYLAILLMRLKQNCVEEEEEIKAVGKDGCYYDIIIIHLV